MYTLAKRSHTHVKDPVVRPCESSVDYGNIKITQHALKLARVFRMFKLDTIRKKKKKKNVSKGIFVVVVVVVLFFVFCFCFCFVFNVERLFSRFLVLFVENLYLKIAKTRR